MEEKASKVLPVLRINLEKDNRAHDNHLMRDERGVVVSWLVKVLVGLAIGGVILFDVGSIAVNFFTLDSAANEIANSLGTEISTGTYSESDVNSLESCRRAPVSTPLCQMLTKKARENDAKILKVNLDLKGELEIRLRRTASTLIVKRIGPIEDWGTATVEGRASTDTQ